VATPAFGRSIKMSETDAAVGALRRSLIIETGAAIAILGLVAGLGTLEPPMSM
jgi:copper resistance protein D